MRRITGEQIGRWSLRVDSAYCAVLGGAVLATAPAVASVLALPAVVISGVGIAVLLWAVVVLGLLSRLRLRAALRLVMTVNVVAAAGVAAVSATAATGLVVLAVLAIAVDVALFAASQAVALRSLRSTTA